MKIKTLFTTLFFAGALNAVFEDKWGMVDWRQAYQERRPSWQKDKDTLAQIPKTVDTSALRSILPQLFEDIDWATMVQALDDLTQEKKNNLLLEIVAYNVPFITQYLLEHGADVNAVDRTYYEVTRTDKDSLGVTPLHRAAVKDHAEMVALLLKRGAAVDYPDDFGWTALQFAARHGHIEIIQLLLAYGANVNSQDNSDLMPLHEAAAYGKTEAAQLLLAHGANVNGQDDDGATPLHDAARKGHIEIVKLFLDHGADTTISSYDNRTAADQAKTNEIRQLITDRKQAGPAGE